MARPKSKTKAEKIQHLFTQANTSQRRQWQYHAQKAYEFYLGDQLSQDEVKSLEESGMPTFIINRITPVIETMKFFVTSGDPRWQAVATEGSDVDLAAVHSSIADYCWYNSDGGSLYGQIVLDSLVKGVGYFFATVDPDGDRGLGEVVYKRVDPFDVYPDPMSRDFLLRDAAYIQIRKVLSKTQLKEMLPAFKRKINAASSNQDFFHYSERDWASSKSITPDDIGKQAYKAASGEEDDILDFIESYSKVKKEFVNVYQRKEPSPSEVEKIESIVDEKMEPIIDEINVSMQEQMLKIQQAAESGDIIPDRASLEIKKLEEQSQESIRSQRIMMINDMMEKASQVVNTVMPKKDFNTAMKSEGFSSSVVDAINFFETRIMVTCIAGDTFLYEYELPIDNYPIIPIPYLYSGTPYAQGAVTPLLGKQQEINKAHQIMIHNANLSSNLRWMYEEGSVDEDDWEQHSTVPGGLLKYRQGFSVPTPVQPLPLNSAFFQITQEGKADLEYISGISPTMQGSYSSSQSPETYRGLLAIDEFGTRRVKSWMSQIVEPALEQLGKMFTQIAQDTYRTQKVFRIVQPNNQSKNVQINVPLYNDFGEKVGLYNDYQSTKFDIRIVAGSTQPVNRWALLDEYFKWFQAGLIDDIAMIAETDIRNKEQIIERKSLYAQLQSQLASMEEAMKDKEGTIETLERQLVQSGIKDKVRQGESAVQKNVLNTETQQKLLQMALIEEQRKTKKRTNKIEEVED